MRTNHIYKLHEKAISILELIEMARKRADAAQKDAQSHKTAGYFMDLSKWYENRAKINLEIAARLTQSYWRVMEKLKAANDKEMARLMAKEVFDSATQNL